MTPQTPIFTFGVLEKISEATESQQTLEARMKTYELMQDQQLRSDAPVILRLDGYSFRKFLVAFATPFDQRLHDAMVNTCSDLLNFLPTATTAYTQSDEITLVFPTGVCCSSTKRVQKILSLAAAYASVRFNMHLTMAVAAAPEPYVGMLTDLFGRAFFHGKLFAVPSIGEALNCLIWRCREDAVRNSVIAFAKTLFSKEELDGKTTDEVLEMMKTEKNVIYEKAVPSWAIEGTTVKKELFEHKGFNRKTGRTVKTAEVRLRAVDKGVREFSDENLKMMTALYWGPRAEDETQFKGKTRAWVEAWVAETDDESKTAVQMKTEEVEMKTEDEISLKDWLAEYD